MKTFTAALANIGIGALQAAAAVPFFDPKSNGAVLANVGVQIGVQAALSALQAYVATRNSNTDPNGKPLAETAPGHFQTEHK